MKVSVVQLDVEGADPEHNLVRAREWVSRAAGAGCDLVVLPEMVDTGYVMADIAQSAAGWDGAFAEGILSAARDERINVVCGLSERGEGRIHNSVMVADRDGRVAGRYRKIHLFAPAREEETCSPGDRIVVCEIDGERWGIAVCYDLRFPEMWRAMAFAGVRGFIIPSAWPFPRLDHWRTLLRARAIENQCYVVAANRVGTDGALTFCGSSQIIDPFGTVVAASGEIETAGAAAEIDLDRIRAVRENMPALSGVRPEVYARGVAPYAGVG